MGRVTPVGRAGRFGLLKSDERGAVLVLFALMLPVIIGTVGLAFDANAYLNLNSDMQEIADAAALAGAAELDGSEDAISNATTAAQSLLSNTPRWSNVPRTGVQIGTPVYYSSLGPDTVTTDPKQAAFIKVTTVNRSVKPILLAVIGRTSAVSTSASAVAKATFTSCVPIQSFLCNPVESSSSNKGNASNFTSAVSVGKMVRLVNGAGAAGNWGLIEPATGSNPHLLSAFWAQNTASGCLANTTGDTRTGNVPKFAQDGMNVRFDAPTGTGDEALSAPIVISGKRKPSNKCSVSDNYTDTSFKQTDNDPTAYQNYCNAATIKGSCPLPRDRSFTSTNIGSGLNTADLQAYWKNHHPGTLPNTISTRYQLYLEEVAGTGNAGTWLTESFENKAPVCNTSTVGPASRRLINVAIVDCSYWGINGKKALPKNTLFARFFMTEPALSDGSIYGELVETYQVNITGGGSYQIVQLVR